MDLATKEKQLSAFQKRIAEIQKKEKEQDVFKLEKELREKERQLIKRENELNKKIKELEAAQHSGAKIEPIVRKSTYNYPSYQQAQTQPKTEPQPQPQPKPENVVKKSNTFAPVQSENVLKKAQTFEPAQPESTMKKTPTHSPPAQQAQASQPSQQRRPSQLSQPSHPSQPEKKEVVIKGPSAEDLQKITDSLSTQINNNNNHIINSITQLLAKNEGTFNKLLNEQMKVLSNIKEQINATEAKLTQRINQNEEKINSLMQQQKADASEIKTQIASRPVTVASTATPPISSPVKVSHESSVGGSEILEKKEALININLQISEKQVALNQLEGQVRNKEDEIKSKENEIRNKENEIKHKDNESKQKEDMVKQKENLVKEKEEQVKQKEEEMRQKENEIREKENDIRQKENDIRQKESDVRQKENDVRQKENETKQKEAILRQKESEIKRLSEQTGNSENMPTVTQEIVPTSITATATIDPESLEQLNNVNYQLVERQNALNEIEGHLRQKIEEFNRITESINQANSQHANILQSIDNSTKQLEEIKSQMKTAVEDLVKASTQKVFVQSPPVAEQPFQPQPQVQPKENQSGFSRANRLESKDLLPNNNNQNENNYAQPQQEEFHNEPEPIQEETNQPQAVEEQVQENPPAEEEQNYQPQTEEEQQNYYQQQGEEEQNYYQQQGEEQQYQQPGEEEQYNQPQGEEANPQGEEEFAQANVADPANPTMEEVGYKFEQIAKKVEIGTATDKINEYLDKLTWPERNLIEIYSIGQNCKSIFAYNPFYSDAEEIEVEFDTKFPSFHSYVNVCPYVYLSGGKYDEESAPSSIRFYRFRRIEKREFSRDALTPMNNARKNHTTVYIPSTNEICAIGGTKMKSCERYNIANNEWTDLPNLSSSRERACCCVYNETFLYVFFGFDRSKSQYATTIEKLNLQEPELWEPINVPGNQGILKKQSFSLMFKNETTILIVGGLNASRKICREVVEYDFEQNEATAWDSYLPLYASFNDPVFTKSFNGAYYTYTENFTILKYLPESNEFIPVE